MRLGGFAVHRLDATPLIALIVNCFVGSRPRGRAHKERTACLLSLSTLSPSTLFRGATCDGSRHQCRYVCVR
eukprot:scaffold186213_cov26-Tisochrysis_lutea.AAC.1